MKALLTLLAVCLVGLQRTTDAWGGLFNRFSPEMLANMGYGGHRGFMHQGVEGDEGVLEEYSNDLDVDPCYGRRCTANEDCCLGSICAVIDGDIGSCIFDYGRRVGELCRRDTDCESGLVCAEAEPGTLTRVCRPPVHQDKQYSELCNMSNECDISRGLCCQLQRRHRQAPRKMCSYFKDPLVCIGPVATDQIKNSVQHTAGEKRLTVFSNYKRPLH